MRFYSNNYFLYVLCTVSLEYHMVTFSSIPALTTIIYIWPQGYMTKKISLRSGATKRYLSL